MIEGRALGRRFGDIVALHDVSLTLPRGKTLCVAGPSGCGKTTLLRILAGLEAPDEGQVLIGGVEASSPRAQMPPWERGVGFVFQQPALWPHLTVAGNVAFGLVGWGREAAQDRVREVLALVGLQGHGGRRPAELSGGQMRRVALARALAPRPPRLLMDEPLTHLDAAAKAELLAAIVAAVADAQASLIYVSHDADEVAALGGQVLTLEAGRVTGAGTSEGLR